MKNPKMAREDGVPVSFLLNSRVLKKLGDREVSPLLNPL